MYYQVKHSVTETATKERPGGNVTGRVFFILILVFSTVATVWIGSWEIILFSPDGNRINETVKPVLSIVRKKLKFTIKLWYFSWKLQR